jgi:hypothetical protein
MSDYIVLHTLKNSEVIECIIPTGFILDITGKKDEGAFIAIAEDRGFTALETVREIAKLLDAEIPLLVQLEAADKQKKSKKLSVANFRSKPSEP